MCLQLALAQRRRETTGGGGSGSSGENCRQGLASARSFMGTGAAGSVKAALVLEAEKKNTSIQKETRHI